VAATRKPTEKSASIASARDALRKEGPVGSIDQDAFEDQLRDPGVQEALENARETWKREYGRDPASSARRIPPN